MKLVVENKFGPVMVDLFNVERVTFEIVNLDELFRQTRSEYHFDIKTHFAKAIGLWKYVRFATAHCAKPDELRRILGGELEVGKFINYFEESLATLKAKLDRHVDWVVVDGQTNANVKLTATLQNALMFLETIEPASKEHKLFLYPADELVATMSGDGELWVKEEYRGTTTTSTSQEDTPHAQPNPDSI